MQTTAAWHEMKIWWKERSMKYGIYLEEMVMMGDGDGEGMAEER